MLVESLIDVRMMDMSGNIVDIWKIHGLTYIQRVVLVDNSVEDRDKLSCETDYHIDIITNC